MEAYKCENPKCDAIHYRPVSTESSEEEPTKQQEPVKPERPIRGKYEYDIGMTLAQFKDYNMNPDIDYKNLSKYKDWMGVEEEKWKYLSQFRRVYADFNWTVYKSGGNTMSDFLYFQYVPEEKIHFLVKISRLPSTTSFEISTEGEINPIEEE